MSWPPPPLPEIGKTAYKAAAATLRAKLLLLQARLRDADFPLLLVFGGVDGAGKHELANLIVQWLDPRFVRTLAYVQEADSAEPLPNLLRYWRDLPAHGETAVVLSGWYSAPLLARARGEISDQDFQARLAEIAEFESDLVADGVLLLKYWMHLDADSQRRRLAALMGDPLNVWQVKPRDWAHLHLYDDFIAATQRLMQRSQHRPWCVVDGQPRRARSLAVLEHVAARLDERLQQAPAPLPVPSNTAVEDQLARVEQPRLGRAEAKRRLREAQADLHRHSQRLLMQNRGLILVFEGWDAAGKGGAIRRLLQALDARYVDVHRIAAPDAAESAQHYLWRFVRRLPRPGHIAIFDRSWYGRVLVERIEGFAREDRWRRAYAEINRFEGSWTAAGHRLQKFWLHISAEEQLARFEARRDDPLKNWKLTDEDWRNRERWPEYCTAVNEMVQLTNTADAPWQLIGANDKASARVAVIEAVNEALAC